MSIFKFGKSGLTVGSTSNMEKEEEEGNRLTAGVMPGCRLGYVITH